MKARLLSMLGICKKAGKLLQGFDIVADAAKLGTIFLILLAQDLSPKSAKEMTLLAQKYHIEIIAAPVLMDEIWYQTGKRAGILAVADKGLAQAVKSKLNRVVIEEDSIV